MFPKYLYTHNRPYTFILECLHARSSSEILVSEKTTILKTCQQTYRITVESPELSENLTGMKQPVRGWCMSGLWVLGLRGGIGILVPFHTGYRGDAQEQASISCLRSGPTLRPRSQPRHGGHGGSRRGGVAVAMETEQSAHLHGTISWLSLRACEASDKPPPVFQLTEVCCPLPIL